MAFNEVEREAIVSRATRGLVAEFQGLFGLDTIDGYVRESLRALEELGARNLRPMFVHRFARERLRALGQSEGRIEKIRPEVLFVCVNNAGPSQMAAALTDQLSDGRVHVRSAGPDPSSEIDPAVIEVMSELGLDLHHELPKPLTDEVVRAADAVITLSCGDACSIYPGKKYEDWEIDDSDGLPIESVRDTRNSLALRVEFLLAELGIFREESLQPS
jgi:arsenate reductase (thioredoxin)